MTINTCKPNQNQSSHFWKVRCLKNEATTNLSNFFIKVETSLSSQGKILFSGIKSLLSIEASSFD